MKKEFETTNLGLMNFFLGIDINQWKHGIFISQTKYAFDLLRIFRMKNCKEAPTPTTRTILNKEDKGTDEDPSSFKRLVGSLMYLTATRPDIMYEDIFISRLMEKLKDMN
jgi:hypothetical protein